MEIRVRSESWSVNLIYFFTDRNTMDSVPCCVDTDTTCCTTFELNWIKSLVQVPASRCPGFAEKWLLSFHFSRWSRHVCRRLVVRNSSFVTMRSRAQPVSKQLTVTRESVRGMKRGRSWNDEGLPEDASRYYLPRYCLEQRDIFVFEHCVCVRSISARARACFEERSRGRTVTANWHDEN